MNANNPIRIVSKFCLALTLSGTAFFSQNVWSCTVQELKVKYDNVDSSEIIYHGVIKVKQNDKLGLVKACKELTPVQYDEIGKFQKNGIAKVKQNGKFGIIERTGKVIIPSLYDHIGFYDNGVVHVQQADKEGIIDENTGKILIPVQYDNIYPIAKDLSYIRQGSFKDGKYGLINHKLGKILLTTQYDDIKRFDGENLHEANFVRVKQNNKWGVVNNAGKLVLPIKYDYINALGEKNLLMIVEKNNLTGIIDINGKVILPLEYTYIDFWPQEGLHLIKKNDDKSGFIDENGIIVIPVQYYISEKFQNGKIKVELNNEIFYIDKTGRKVE